MIGGLYMGSKVSKRISARVLPVVLLALLICITIGFTGLLRISNAVQAYDNVEILTENNTVEFDLTKQVSYQYCSFTPGQTGYYMFSFDETDGFAVEKDLYEGNSYITYTYSSSLIYKLQAGSEYILKIGSWFSQPGTITISVARYYPEVSGYCGDDATWSYDMQTETLTISGEGDMYDYESYAGGTNPCAPWELFQTEMKRVIIGDNITYIGCNAFINCESLETASIGKRVKTLGFYAFQNCEKLKSVSIPQDSQLTTINSYAFGACSKLEDFAIPGTVTYIGNYAFSSCAHLTEANLPKNLEYLGEGAFTGCDTITEVTIPDGITCIEESTFYSCDNLSEITIPETVTKIGQKAFSYCYKLENITLPFGITRIEDYLFYDCMKLESIDIPDTVNYIGSYAFFECSSLSSIEIPEGVTSIKEYTFNYCSSLSSVSLPSTVTSIDINAFCNCRALSEINLPAALTEIGTSAFNNCQNLSNIVFGENLTRIGNYAFQNCSSLTEITLPESLEYLGEQAFYYCSSLKKATIGGGYLESSCFYSCGNLETVILGKNVKDIGRCAFGECTRLISISIPGSVSEIGPYAFYQCTSLEDLTIEEGVTRIGDSAFLFCSKLEEVTLPASIIRIDSGAFNTCTSIENVYCYASPAKLEWTGANNDFIPWSSGGSSQHGQTKCHVLPSEYDAFQAKFGYGIANANAAVNVTFVGDLPDAIDMDLGEHLFGYSISLDGDIGVNFYMDLSKATLSDDAYMEFSVPSGDSTVTQKIYVKAKAGENRTVARYVPNGENPYYVFKCQVAPKDFASTIRAHMVDGSRSGEIYSYTVKSYAQYILAHTNDDPAYAKAAPLVKSLMQYCSWAQLYFGTGHIDWGCFNDAQLTALTSSEIQQAAPAFVKDLDQLPGVTFEYASLSLKSETTLSLYFRSDEKLTFSCKQGNVIDVSRGGGYQIVRIRGIAAADLDTLYEITVTCGDKQGTVKYSALNYISAVITQSNDSDLICITKAMFLYYKEAEAYFA